VKARPATSATKTNPSAIATGNFSRISGDFLEADKLPGLFAEAVGVSGVPHTKQRVAFH